MSKPTIPETNLEWASSDITDPGSGQDNKVEPSASKKTNGWIFLEKPPFNWLNYWQNLTYQYILWIVQEGLEGVFTFTGVKTFDDIPVLPGTDPTAANEATRKDYVDAIFRDSSGTETSVQLKRKVIEIGDWNMDSTVFVSIAHGLSDYTKIRSLSATIRNDLDNFYLPFVHHSTSIASPADNNGEIGVDLSDTSKVKLQRTTNGVFDSSSFDSTSYNRGWIFIEYQV